MWCRAVEYNPERCEAAEELVIRTGSSVEIHQGDAKKFDMQAVGRKDLVTMVVLNNFVFTQRNFDKKRIDHPLGSNMP